MNPIIWVGLTLVILSTLGILACALLEKRAERRARRLACLQDPVNCRQILSR